MVDWYHATEHLSNATKVLLGEDTPTAKRLYDQWETKLYLGRIDDLVKSMKSQIIKHPRKAKAVLKEASYFQKNGKRMNYQGMRNEGYPIGSGIVESAGKQYKACFCGAGMHWKP